MTTHTPGPWKAIIDPCHYDSLTDIRAANGNIVACTGGKVTVSEMEANARLISAAPDMFEALKGMTSLYRDLVDSGDCGFWDADKVKEVRAANAAIAKAEGRNG